MRPLCALADLAEGSLHAIDCTPARDSGLASDPQGIPGAGEGDAPDPGAPGPDSRTDGALAESIIVLRVGESVRAWRNVCPHAGRRLDWAPGRFLRDGPHLVCAHHGAVFELAGGECVSGPCRGSSLVAVRTEMRPGGEIWIDP